MSEPSVSSEKPPAIRRAWSRLRRRVYQVATHPILAKETRARMRGWRAPAVLTVHLALLSCFATLIYAIAREAASAGSGDAGRAVGQTLYYSIYLMLLALVVFLSPAFTAGAISGEREKRTLDILLTTLLPVRSLVLGKLASALAYVALLVLAALPVQSLAFVFGGVALYEVLIGTLLLAVTALVAGSVGLAISSFTRSTVTSTALTYATIMLSTLGLPLLVVIVLSFLSVLFDELLGRLDWIQQAIAIYAGGALLCTNPFATAVATQLARQEQGSLFLLTVQVADEGGVSHTLPLLSPWIVYTILAIVASALLIRASVWAIEHKT